MLKMLGCAEPSTDDEAALDMALAMIRNANSKSTADNLEDPNTTKENAKKKITKSDSLSAKCHKLHFFG
jgi:hypothetical protein